MNHYTHSSHVSQYLVSDIPTLPKLVLLLEKSKNTSSTSQLILLSPNLYLVKVTFTLETVTLYQIFSYLDPRPSSSQLSPASSSSLLIPTIQKRIAATYLLARTFPLDHPLAARADSNRRLIAQTGVIVLPAFAKACGRCRILSEGGREKQS